MAKPCAKHPVKVNHDHKPDRAACLKQHKRMKARARMAWPPRPTVSEIRKRVGDYNWRTARRIAICETGMNLNHYPSGRYRGPLGMFVTTQAYGIRATGYTNPTTWQEHVAIAVAAHPITRGWSGWGCS